MKNEIIQILDDIRNGPEPKIIGLRKLNAYRDFFGDIGSDIPNRIAGIDSQTDHLIFQGGCTANIGELTDSDLVFFDDEIERLVSDIEIFLDVQG